MTSESMMRWMVRFYILLFFTYLFGPLLMMSASAFNDASYPQVVPWEGFTWKWFGELARDQKLIKGVSNSLWIGLGVVCVSVPIGLAAAVLMMQVHQKARAFYYTVVVSPVLIPGVILGLSTLIFWDRLGTYMEADYETFYYNGIFLTIIGQSTFISAYTMLVFIARIQRFDRTQEEAALDLGATHVQVFWKVLVPFLRPAIFSAGVLAFLTSFENYNTTVFTIQSESTLTVALASKVRLGTTPALSALAVVIVAITVVCAILYEVLRRREQAKEEARQEAAKRAENAKDMSMIAQTAT